MKANRGGRQPRAALEVETVTMDNVPTPPVSDRAGRWVDLYAKVRALGMGERNAIKVRLAGKSEFAAARAALRKFADRENLRAVSSRSDDYRVGYFWLVKPDAV